ncbi:MAG: hypothetical protein ACMXYD_00515 [Candidatus Woesearchaeota archaeon]
MIDVTTFVFGVYHDTVGQHQGSPPAYAQDPTSIFWFWGGFAVLIAVLAYLYVRAQKQTAAKQSGKRKKKK